MNSKAIAMMERAVREATDLEARILDSGHILLALLREEEAPAARALRAVGATRQRILEVYRPIVEAGAQGPDDEPRPQWMWNARGQYIVAFAEGLAVGQGVPLGDEHFLLALAFDEIGLTAAVFRKLGVDRARLVEVLAELGVSVPGTAPPPDPPPVDWDETVDISTDDLRKVLRDTLAGARRPAPETRRRDPGQRDLTRHVLGQERGE
jgi:ATP-dependent Clp protease ATP-binding subunit ClpA